METLVSELYSGASASVIVSVHPKGAYKYIRAIDNDGVVLCDMQFELLTLKMWARSNSKCSQIGAVINPQWDFAMQFDRIQQFILRVVKNDEEKKTYYTMEVCSYV